MGAARYKPYPAYKPSYAAWSGDVPDHWSPIRLKHVFAEKKKVHNSELPAGSISFGNVIYKNEESLAKETKAAYQELRCGEFLINPLNMNYDLLSLRTALSSIDVVVSTGYMILQSVEGYDKNYLRWLLQQFDVAHMKTLGAGVRQTISYADIGNSFIFEPPLPEQKKIAAFLDHETGKIDALIEKQEWLIALLKEKRQAVISHAVTKGLNPNAPLRPSGIDWLGDVPEHWEVSRLGYFANKIGSGKTPRGGSEVYQTEGVLFLRSQNVYNDGLRISENEATFISSTVHEEMKGTKVLSGDILLNITGGSIGRTCIVPNWIGEANVNQHVCIIRCDESIREFLAIFLKSDVITSQVDLLQVGGNREGLNFEQIAKLVVCVPPEDERAMIVDSIEESGADFIKLLNQAQSAITLLKERRTALISAAVTGKIDVRDWRPPQPLSDTDLSTETFQEAIA